MQENRVAVVIEDEADIRHLLSDVLEAGGFEVHAAGNGIDGVELVRRYQPVVTTLDVSMPGIDGYETAKRIRAISTTYIVMLTARSDELDALQGLESGADDYLTKPFRPRELRARIEAMLRRPRTQALGEPDAAEEPELPAMPPTAPVASPAPAAPPKTVDPVVAHGATDDAAWIEHHGLRIHPGMRLVRRDGEEIDVTPTEFEILTEVLTAKGRVVGKTHLAMLRRGDQPVSPNSVSDADARAVEVHMANLRRKLGESPSEPRWIETVRGVGYRLTR